jgi:cytochrome c-type biogenesis protein CcmF
VLVIGQAALLVTFLAAAWSCFAGAVGAITRSDGLAASAGRGLVASFLLTLAATLALTGALLTDDFSLAYVASYSALAQPTLYKFAALWGGQAGSLLVWLLLLTGCAAVAVAGSRRIPRDMLGWFYATVAVAVLLFAVMVAFVANPFVRIPPGNVPPDGNGMNPLLLNPWMMIHPPTLLIGYVGTTFPFAFAVASLLCGRSDDTWIRLSRRWMLFTFVLLSLGILLGAYWAYIELGWGGYWAWDPVENASLMPWLVLVAYIHSAIVQERRGMLKTWNVALVGAAFLLSIFGTFLTRSGIISSVHAFGQSSIGTWFGVFLIVATLAFIALVIVRFRRLRSDQSLSQVAVISRESAVLSVNVLLTGVTLIVFFLTMYPVYSELTMGQQITREPAEFTQSTAPWFLLIVLLMGVGPLISWRRTSLRRAARRFAPHLAAGLVTIVLLALLGAREPWSLAFFGAVVFTASCHVGDFAGAIRTRRRHMGEGYGTIVGKLLGHHRRRYGGYLVHVGVVLAVIGIAGSGPYRTEMVVEEIQPGDTVTIDGYELTYEGFEVSREPMYDALAAMLAVRRPGGDELASIAPERRIYRRGEQLTTEVAVLPTIVPRSLTEMRRLGEDLYVIQVHVDTRTSAASFQLITQPFINWLWLGGLVMMFGGTWAAWPARTEPVLVFDDGVAGAPSSATA